MLICPHVRMCRREACRQINTLIVCCPYILCAVVRVPVWFIWPTICRCATICYSIVNAAVLVLCPWVEAILNMPGYGNYY